MPSFAPLTPAAPGHDIDSVDGDREINAMIARELDPGERVVLAVRPRVATLVRRSFAALLFGIPWTSFAVFWMWGAAQASILFALFGLPFVGIGALMLTAPLWTARAAKRSVSVVTDRRVILIGGSPHDLVRLFRNGSAVSVRSLAPTQLQDLERREAADGSGDLVLERRTAESGKRGAAAEVAINAVPNVREVEKAVRALAATAQKGP